ncbi:glycogen phosphorylase GlgP [Bacillus atrophaeus]|uniref:glycogen phosphorylase GlgP n=1 Tax=Bacillus atrophaeus TaxID=1452 RepID=UPI00228182DA|nr:glycogen phosphorylase GlgP [Bacillus atrophaeus]MCY8514578.1 glycogen phosphorylase GlgP [Bacillus atrophaeus]MCY8991775.1 glycogen phosphorylase GlgP [Bacillus atrophaeus]
MFSSKERFAALFLQRLEMTCGKSFKDSTKLDQYKTLGIMVREYISSNWIQTNEKSRSNSGKQTYYLSIEFLLGQLLDQNLINLGVRDVTEAGLKEIGISLQEVLDIETDAGLGNGGLGRLAACFLDSLASLNLPGHGMGIRYKHGLFEQKIVDGHQVELPEQWLKNGNVWEVRNADQSVDVPFWGHVNVYEQNGRLTFRHEHATLITAVPYDIPVIGYDTGTVNTLRLWNAEPYIHHHETDILSYKRETEAVSEFLYPDDTHDEGKILRLKQQYFLVCASVKSIVNSYRKTHKSLYGLHKKVSIHINDTHPALAVPELMRILLDEEKMSWEEAWHITVHTISYTNHTTLSEALEKWPIHLFKPLLPRMYMIIEEINERFCRSVWEQYPGDWKRIENAAIIAHGVVKMAHLAIVGSYSVNGVAKIHSDILKEREMKGFHILFPKKFNNKTNGITHRRWLLKANPDLSAMISDSIGERWIKQPEALIDLKSFAYDAAFIEQFQLIKEKKKQELADIIFGTSGVVVNPESIFDVQVKRLHAYKRQLLNVLHIMYLYNRLKEDSGFSIHPQTFIFGAKASPSYYYAKKIIKLIHSVADKVNYDPAIRGLIKVVFLENYRVSLAERIFPASDVSEQISTASKEASGTGNMKFMMNGALTIGTHDGANIEILERVGPDCIYTFGLKADEVLSYYENGGYRSREYYQHDRRIRQVADQLINGFFEGEADEFESIYDSLLPHNDEYFVLKDFSSYLDAQERIQSDYRDRGKWSERSIVNIAHSGYFSSDRTIREYADDIWGIKPME